MRFFAYIDPGLGLLLWQSVVALCLGVLFYLKKTRAWIVKLLRKPFRPARPPEDVAEKSENVPK